MATKEFGKATPEQIEEWKKKARTGRVYQLTAETEEGIIYGYVQRPSRKALSRASVVAGKDPIRFTEVIIRDAWLGGDERMQNDDSLFMGVAEQLDQLLEKTAVELKEL